MKTNSLNVCFTVFEVFCDRLADLTGPLDPEDEGTRSFDTSVTVYTATMRHISEEFNSKVLVVFVLQVQCVIRFLGRGQKV
jgi:hypothetical protein